MKPLLIGQIVNNLILSVQLGKMTSKLYLLMLLSISISIGKFIIIDSLFLAVMKFVGQIKVNLAITGIFIAVMLCAVK